MNMAQGQNTDILKVQIENIVNFKNRFTGVHFPIHIKVKVCVKIIVSCLLKFKFNELSCLIKLRISPQTFQLKLSLKPCCFLSSNFLAS
jgi:hypothetical protein